MAVSEGEKDSVRLSAPLLILIQGPMTPQGPLRGIWTANSPPRSKEVVPSESLWTRDMGQNVQGGHMCSKCTPSHFLDTYTTIPDASWVTPAKSRPSDRPHVAFGPSVSAVSDR